MSPAASAAGLLLYGARCEHFAAHAFLQRLFEFALLSEIERDGDGEGKKGERSERSAEAEEEDGVCDVILFKEGGAEGGFDIEFAFFACFRNGDRLEFALPSVVIGIEFGDGSFFARGAVFVDGDEGAVRRLLRAVISAPFFGKGGEEIDDFVLARLILALGLLFGDEGVFLPFEGAVLPEICPVVCSTTSASLDAGMARKIRESAKRTAKGRTMRSGMCFIFQTDSVFWRMRAANAPLCSSDARSTAASRRFF